MLVLELNLGPLEKEEEEEKVEVELGYIPSEEYLQPGEDVALDGLLVVEEVGVVHNVAVEA